MDIDTAINFYLYNINVVLPKKALEKQWSIKFNHCFSRCILDNVFKDCWYNHLHKNTAAYKQLTEEQLSKANNIIILILNDDTGAVIKQLNKNSLIYRNKFNN